MTTVIVYSLLAVALAVSFGRDRHLTFRALRLGLKMFVRLLPSLVAVVGLVGLFVSLVPPEAISRYLGAGSGVAGTLAAAFIGAVTLLPGFVSYPLAASLMRAGATVTTTAAFITTLTMVGVMTASAEVKQLGLRFTVVRNVLAFLAALIIAFLMGVLL